MENHPPTETKDRWTIAIVVGLSLAYGLLVVCVALFLAFDWQYLPANGAKEPASTATPPHILAAQPASDVKVTREDFSSNIRNWSAYYYDSKVEARDGKLFIESFVHNQLAMAYCESCSFVISSNPRLESPFYLQADFSSDKYTAQYYGLIFSLLIDDGSCYAFEIDPSTQTYILAKRIDGAWIHLQRASSNSIDTYPATNTLGIDFSAGTMVLYINGKSITTYVDKSPLAGGKIGAIVDDAGFVVSMDNLFAYHKK